jgi:hypothetical protein
MTQLIYGFAPSQAIAVAAQLGLADLLKEEAKSIGELAGTTKAHASSLRRLLRALTSLGIFAEDVDDRFRQTPRSELLRSDHPRSVRTYAMMFGSELLWRPWGELHSAVMTGRSGFEHVFHASFFEHTSAHPGDAELFNAAMTSSSAIDAAGVVAAYDFSRFERIVDVGGGHGGLLHAILSANPKLRGVLFDQREVVAGAVILRSGALAARCEIASGDFFQSVPNDADAYIMRGVMHDWSDDEALKILKNCREAIRRDGRLLIVDSVLRPSNEPDFGKFRDLNMLVLLSGGRERTQAEFAELLAKAGFSLSSVILTSGMSSIVESHPI